MAIDSGRIDGWCQDALSRDYCAFDPELLALNDTLCDELLFSAHLMQVQSSSLSYEADGDDKAAEDKPTYDLDQFVQACAESFALDSRCLVCRTLDLYRNRYGFSAPWMADYAMLCSKCLSSPPCAVTTFIAAFELVYIMDKHFLRRHRATLVGSFARRTLTLNDVQRHFFIHGCFRTDGGIPTTRVTRSSAQVTDVRRCGGGAKVRYSNYSYMAQTVTRIMLCTLSQSQGNDSVRDSNGGRDYPSHINYTSSSQAPAGSQSLLSSLVGWKDCAKSIDCLGSSPQTKTVESCVTRAIDDNDEFEREVLETGSYKNDRDVNAEIVREGLSDQELVKIPPSYDSGSHWAYADLALLLLSGTNSVWVTDDKTQAATTARYASVTEFWNKYRVASSRDVAPKFKRFTEQDAEPVLDLGPVLATVLKHTRCRGRTGAECLLCNLLPIRDYWFALRRLKRDVVAYSANNIGLFDCVYPVLDAWAEDGIRELNDGGRFSTLLKAAGPEAIYKHLFCDPMCSLSELQTNPRVLFGHPPKTNQEELALYKARLASENRFEGRVCAGLWVLAYTFKSYQIFPPKPTALAAFIRDANSILKKHSLSLVSLEHTLGTYV
ncbi:DNA packaging protein UL32 [Spheniscid alphaherpesvirus 1]|uniref:Packaging protein UL32 n=1 Tax=Spheniscid alphaherpesvirus 1 TaxID=2560777 RepID=A0A1R3T436_9ALPH|nr:DNA packaging protein UL32 [Spheniscid alphaherpesvirus 1]SCO83538.1 DNA packaging protein UL32 [Spheniscid alphaherpesvirus 1]